MLFTTLLRRSRRCRLPMLLNPLRDQMYKLGDLVLLAHPQLLVDQILSVQM